MKKHHSVQEILRILGEVEKNGKNGQKVCRENNISAGSYYRWRGKYEGMELSEALRLKELEEENRRLKLIVADQALHITVLKEVNSKKW